MLEIDLAARNSPFHFDGFTTHKGLHGLLMMAIEIDASTDDLGDKSKVWSLGAICAEILEWRFLLC